MHNKTSYALFAIFFGVMMLSVLELGNAYAISSGEGRWDFSFADDFTISKNELISFGLGDKLNIDTSVMFHGYAHSGTADIILSVTDPDGTEKQYLQKLDDMKIDETRKVSFEYFPDMAGKYNLEMKIMPPDGISSHIFDKKTGIYDFGVIDLDVSESIIKLKIGGIKIAKVFGSIAKHFTLERFPVYTTMIFPDGSEMSLKTRITSSGYFEVPMLFNEKSMPGIYHFVTRYQDYQSQTVRIHVNSLYS